MRLILAAVLATMTGLATAQTAPPSGAPPQGGPGRGPIITRDEFTQRAAIMAGQRFDEIDKAHTGTITGAQLREWRQAHQGQLRPAQ